MGAKNESGESPNLSEYGFTKQTTQVKADKSTHLAPVSSNNSSKVDSVLSRSRTFREVKDEVLQSVDEQLNKEFGEQDG